MKEYYNISRVESSIIYLGWSGWGISPQIWSAIALITTTAIAATISIQRADMAFVLVIVWAFVGIAVRHENIPLIAITAGGLALALTLLLVFSVLHHCKSHE